MALESHDDYTLIVQFNTRLVDRRKGTDDQYNLRGSAKKNGGVKRGRGASVSSDDGEESDGVEARRRKRRSQLSIRESLKKKSSTDHETSESDEY